MRAAPAPGEPVKARVRDLRPRVRDLQPRVRDLESRWRALDDSERVVATGERTTVTFAADVLFEFDRADLTPAARARLGELARQLSGLGARPITVAGHTDSHGEPAYNQDLSLQRARAVEAALRGPVGAGFTFEVSGHGEDRPVAPNENTDGTDHPSGRALNRQRGRLVPDLNSLSPGSGRSSVDKA